jgi:hypothetical protein
MQVNTIRGNYDYHLNQIILIRLINNEDRLSVKGARQSKDKDL